MPWPVPIFQDGDYSAADSISLPEFESPIPGLSDEVLFTQRWTMSRNAYDAAGPLALNTPHPVYPAYVLVEEGPRRDLSGGMVEFVRTYAKVPPSHSDPQDTNYSFIGTTISAGGGGGIAPTLITRDRRQWKVKSKVQYNYFLVPSVNITDPITGDVYSINRPEDIEQILDMQYVFQNTVNGALLGGIQLATDTLNVAGSALPTFPSSDQYGTQIADALQNGWNGTVTKIVLFPTSTLAGNPLNSGHMAGTIDTNNTVLGGIIPAEPSSITRWKGNIYQRATRYVLAR